MGLHRGFDSGAGMGTVMLLLSGRGHTSAGAWSRQADACLQCRSSRNSIRSLRALSFPLEVPFVDIDTSEGITPCNTN